MENITKSSDNTDSLKNTANTLVLKIKMKGFYLAGMICYIDLKNEKVIKSECIAINGGALLTQFDVSRSYNTLQDMLFAIKFRGEKYDVGYSKHFSEVISIDLNEKNHVPKIIKLAHNNDIEKITDLFTDLFKYVVTNYFELAIGIEWINLDFENKENSVITESKSAYTNMFEILPVASPVKGTPAIQLKKDDVIYIKFADNSAMGQQIKKQLQNISKNENKDEESLIATVKELFEKNDKSIRTVDIIVEIANDIFGQCSVPQTLKIKKYNPVEENVASEIPKPDEIKQDDADIQKNQEITSQQSANKIFIISIIVFIIIALIIFFNFK